jgi:hypothetical protein
MTTSPISALRQRMIEDMTVRGFKPSTERGYIVAVRNFTAFLGRPPDQADGKDLRRYQLHMRRKGASATSMNATVSALRFFFGVTLGRDDARVAMTTVPTPASPAHHIPSRKTTLNLQIPIGRATSQSAPEPPTVSSIEACPTPRHPRPTAPVPPRQVSDNP